MGQLAKNTINSVRDAMEKMKPQLAMAAPRHMTPDRICRIAMTSIQRNPKLLDCTIESLMGCMLTCTQLGLEADGVSGRAYLIPYKVKGVPTCTLIPGYKGLMELARRSPDVLDFFAPQVVRVNDKFDYELGQCPKLTHKPADGERGDITHYYAVALLASGERPFHVMTKADIDKIRNEQLAKAYDAKTSPWTLHEEAMGLKTVVRRFCKWLPSSAELQQAVALDEQAEADIPQGIDIVSDVAATSEPAEPPTTLADRMADKKGKGTEKKSNKRNPPPAPATKEHVMADVVGPEPPDDVPDAAEPPPTNAGQAATLLKEIKVLAKQTGEQAKINAMKVHGAAMLSADTDVETLKSIVLDLQEIAEALG